ncbi:relaxase/mobilization nuclease domain-containing protein [Leuconostocaceae bacterium ESL0958]|nr:relaxase/mobilization nuclease domain-containing protein [Leuconostocaceae bacterium ESL0958]
MVYTKHKVIHTFKQMHYTENYIKNEAKTILRQSDGGQQLNNTVDYITDPGKTDEQRLVSGHLISNLNNVYDDFINTKYMAAISQGKYLKVDSEGKMQPPTLADFEAESQKGKAQLGHHLIQSFAPEDDLTPEQVHEIGRQTALELTGGNHQFVIATHIDKGHLHNHIIFNSTNSLTNRQFRWQKGTQKSYEDISNKIASKYGAKIIDKAPKNSHAQYTKWQANNLFKKKIKARLDFLLANANSKEDFLAKAKALSLLVNDQGKHTKFKLLDEDQQNWTRARALNKRQPDYYQMDQMVKTLNNNELDISVEEVVNEYIEQVNTQQQDFTWQVEVEPWQIYASNHLGIYLNVDFGSDRQGQVFIHGNYLDQLDNGHYALYLSDDDYFPLTEDQSEQPQSISKSTQAKRPARYMKGSTLVRQLTAYNGRTPVRKEPVMKSMQDYLAALDFYAKHGDGRLVSGQSQRIEAKLLESMLAARNKLRELDQRIIELKQTASKELSAASLAGFVKEQEALTVSRDALYDQYQSSVTDLDYYRGLSAKYNPQYQAAREEQSKVKKEGPKL